MKLPTKKHKVKVKASQKKKVNLSAPVFQYLANFFEDIANYFWKLYWKSILKELKKEE